MGFLRLDYLIMPTLISFENEKINLFILYILFLVWI